MVGLVRRRVGEPLRLAQGPLGMSWQIVPRRLHELLADANTDRARRATEAMLRMSKLNIAELERAADGR